VPERLTIQSTRCVQKLAEMSREAREAAVTRFAKRGDEGYSSRLGCVEDLMEWCGRGIGHRVWRAEFRRSGHAQGGLDEVHGGGEVAGVEGGFLEEAGPAH
jgi:hypothetical protein